MTLSMWELRNALPHVDPTALLLAQVHDAIYIECAEARAEDVKALLEKTMSKKLRFHADAEWMPFPASGKVGNTWLEVG